MHASPRYSASPWWMCMACLMVSTCFSGQANQAALGRQLDVHAEPVGMAPGFGDQQRVGIGNRLEVDVAAKFMLFAQQLATRTSCSMV